MSIQEQWERELNARFFGSVPIDEMGTNQVDEQTPRDFIRANFVSKAELEKVVEELDRAVNNAPVPITPAEIDAATHGILSTLRNRLRQ